MPRCAAENLRLLSFSLDDGIAAGNDPASNTRWHKIGVEGEWAGHWMGPFSLSRRDFEQAVLYQRGRDTKLLVDYEHKSLMAMFSGADSRAAGWADALEIRAAADGSSELWARIEWTQPAADAIREREYRYTSPVFAWRTRDRVSGADLGTSVPSIALTNTPFLEELPEVTLNNLGLLMREQPAEDSMLTKEQYAALCSALSLGADATAEDIMRQLSKQAQDGKLVERICGALDIEPGSAGDAIVASASALRAKAITAADPAELARLREEVAGIKADTALKAALAEGKIVASNREWATALAKRDSAAFSEWAASAPVVVPVGDARQKPIAASAATTGSDELTPERVTKLVSALSETQRKAALSCGLSLETFVKHGLTARERTELLAG
jgi:phage I-like protein